MVSVWDWAKMMSLRFYQFSIVSSFFGFLDGRLLVPAIASFVRLSSSYRAFLSPGKKSLVILRFTLGGALVNGGLVPAVQWSERFP